MENKTIAVAFGGASAEHDISIITGQFIISQLEKTGCSVVPIYIGHDAQWYIGSELGKLSFFKDKKDLSPYMGWSVLNKDGRLLLSKKKGLSVKKYEIDLVFPAFHGTNGEDGAFQGYCQFLNIPYAGAPMEGSAVAMNKTLTKQALVGAGISTPNYVAFNNFDWNSNRNEQISKIESKLSYPVFVKPPHAGSSIGVSKAENKDELVNGIELALHYDNDCLVEEGIVGARDVTVAVMGNKDLQTSVGQESHSADGMLSYDDKYINDGGAQFGGSDDVMTIPAVMKPETEKEMMNLAKKVFSLLGLSGTSRVDFLLDDQENITVIEVNPLPGTLYNHLWEKSGVSGVELVTKLVELGFEAYEARQETSHEFNSSVLQHANNMKLKLD